MKYKLIAIDMDGTLLNDEKAITDKNLFMINKAKENNVKIVIASGRVPGGLKFYENTIAKGEPMICSNGGIVLDDNKKTIFNNGIPKDKLFKIIDILREKKDTYYHFYHNDIMCTEKLEFGSCKFYNFNKNIDRKYRMEIRIVPNSKEYVKKIEEPISKIVIMDEDFNYLKELEEMINRVCSVSITRSDLNNLEITNEGIDKGQGLSILSDYYKIPLSECIAIGNDENDISMIKKAGIGVVMKNARDYVKSFGDYTTLRDNNEDGIAEVIEKFIF
ncbi:HAD family phosphatase [Clostridium niameyense]|uniref:HAD family phosphatase n=1 Tax=Clostridium niameyense TaxID=1622073 RepID=A0A6M0R8P4_9CLOT|nr:Cof-type HAD-IIB family hydrolase [Clostridium niameyense]NEZ45949.1 HAD family phosphatase [Clostridium niameyense]